MTNYFYYIVKFESITDGSDSYRFVVRPNNSRTQLVGVSENYPSKEAAIDGVRQMKGFATPEIKDEAERLVDETEHFRIWKNGDKFDFEIRENDSVLLTSARGYEEKAGCKKELISILKHLDSDIKDLDVPTELSLKREYFGVK